MEAINNFHVTMLDKLYANTGAAFSCFFGTPRLLHLIRRQTTTGHVGGLIGIKCCSLILLTSY